MRKRLDFFIIDALHEFKAWYQESTWQGKERDCVNMFALGFLAKNIHPDAAIKQLTQIRIESPVPQPGIFTKPAAAKDLVIWENGTDTTWNEKWEPEKVPKAVIEFKTVRDKQKPKQFDRHDADWLIAFSAENPGSVAILVMVYDGPDGRTVEWMKV